MYAARVKLEMSSWHPCSHAQAFPTSSHSVTCASPHTLALQLVHLPWGNSHTPLAADPPEFADSSHPNIDRRRSPR
jgi:hypothetical protein